MRTVTELANEEFRVFFCGKKRHKRAIDSLRSCMKNFDEILQNRHKIYEDDTLSSEWMKSINSNGPKWFNRTEFGYIRAARSHFAA